MRGVLPEQWALGSSARAAEARERFEARPHDFVAKSALRPRTGSGATQDRKTSGGVPRTSSEEIAELMASRAAEWFLLYPKVRPQTHSACIIHHGELQHIAEATSEVAAFGSFLATAQVDGNETLIDETAGFGARTRPADPTHLLAAGLGYGALNCVASLQSDSTKCSTSVRAPVGT